MIAYIIAGSKAPILIDPLHGRQHNNTSITLLMKLQDATIYAHICSNLSRNTLPVRSIERSFYQKHYKVLIEIHVGFKMYAERLSKS